MDTDPYAPCPGGTGKKLKFCCADLIADLDKLSRMVAGEQRAAALEFVEKLDAKYPDRACLLSSKAMLQAELGQTEQSATTVAHFREKHPENPVALAESAILAARENPSQAVELLQMAFERADKQLPMQIYDGLGVVALGLLSEGEVLAARAHLMLQFGLSGGKDEQTLRLIVQVQGSPEVHLLLKENQPLVEAPEGALWKRPFDAALENARSGRWLAAVGELQALADKAGEWPAIVRNIAVLRGWLAQPAAAITAWRKYAAQEVPLDDAVEAQAAAQLLDRDEVDQVDIVRTVYSVRDAETLLATLSMSRRALRMPGDLRALAAENEPPPKGYFSLLDRPKPAAGATLTLESTPRILGQALVYGKQTDRDAQLELMAARPDVEACRAALVEVAGEALGPLLEELVGGQIAAGEDLLSLKFYVPEEAPPAVRRELLSEGHRNQLLKEWPELPQRFFGGLSAREAARDPKQKIAVLAAILVLDLGGDTLLTAADFNRLRSELGVPEPQPIDPARLSVLELPYARLARLEVEKLSDQDLLLAHDRAQEVRFTRAMRLLGREIVRRPSLDKEVDKAGIYALLAQLEGDLTQAVTDLDEARRIAAAAGKSSARIDLVELAVRMGQGDVHEADRLLAHIRDEHLREPGIAQALYSMLAQWGIVRPDGSMPAEPVPQQQGIVVPGAAPAQGGGKIWTPGAEPAPGGAKKSAIWTPGME
jgi:hypothetical protein